MMLVLIIYWKKYENGDDIDYEEYHKIKYDSCVVIDSGFYCFEFNYMLSVFWWSSLFGKNFVLIDKLSYNDADKLHDNDVRFEKFSNRKYGVIFCVFVLIAVVLVYVSIDNDIVKL